MGFQEWVRRRPLWSSVAAVVAFAIVTFPAWLATIWPLFSNRPFVEVMGDQGWGWLVIGPAYGWISVALLLACLAVLFVILGTTLNVKQPVAPVSGFSPVSERPIRILERYYQRLLQIRQRAEDAKIEGDLYAARVSLNELRGELINFAPQTLSTATAMDLQAPSN